MQECYLLLVVVAVMMLHGMAEESALMNGDALKQVEAITSNTNQANQHALILAQGLKQ